MTLASTADGPGGGITATAADIDYHLEYPSEILDGFMYLGSWGSAKSKTVLTHLAITHVVNATAVCEMPFEDELKYIQTALDDKPGADIRQFFEQTIEFVEACEAAGGRVSGCRWPDTPTPPLTGGRSGAHSLSNGHVPLLDTGYPLAHEKARDEPSGCHGMRTIPGRHKFRAASHVHRQQAFVRQRRTFINPNPGFLEQLGRYEVSGTPKRAQRGMQRPHAAAAQVELFGSTTIRFPDDGKPITLRTIYSWRQDDGSWVDRVVAGYAT